MSDRVGRAAAAPRWVTVWGPIATFLLNAGVPLGFNGPQRQSHHGRTRTAHGDIKTEQELMDVSRGKPRTAGTTRPSARALAPR